MSYNLPSVALPTPPSIACKHTIPAPTTITADELTEGDLIRHLGNNWQVISEPQYTTRGITFEVLWLDLEQPNTQEVTFDPNWRFELIDHRRSAA